MPAISTFIPFVLLLFHNDLHDLYYSVESDGGFSAYWTPQPGYAATTLYAEAETRLFVANNSESSDYESSDYLYMEEVRVFLKNNNNNSKVYFKLEESASVIEMTTNKSEAAFFTLKTTPDLHRLGQFQLVYATSNVSQTRTPANPMQDEIIIKLDSEGPRTQYGPYKLLSYTEQCRNIVHFKIRGKSTTLPELQ